MAPFMSREEFERAGKEMEEQARRRRASQPPGDPTPGPSYPSLKEGMAKEAKKLAEEDRQPEGFQQPESPTPGSSSPT